MCFSMAYKKNARKSSEIRRAIDSSHLSENSFENSVK